MLQQLQNSSAYMRQKFIFLNYYRLSSYPLQNNYNLYCSILNQQFQMQRFRIKPSSSQASQRRSQTPQSKNEQIFPFSNKKLKIYGWQQDALSIKRMKSHIQISRRNYQFIPNLKKITLDDQKISIVKSAKNEYNIFMRKSQNKINAAQNMNFINGVKSSPNKQKGIFCNSKLYKFNTLYSNPQSNTLLYTNRFQKWADFTSNSTNQTVLKIAGEPKCISPSRLTGRQKISSMAHNQ